jgi:replicative DNA helicase
MTYSKNNSKNLNGKKQNTEADFSQLPYGYVPPKAEEIEEAILGAVMLEKDAIDTVMATLPVEAFYVDKHQSIYKAMLSLSKKSQPIDTLTVSEELKATVGLESIGGIFSLVKLTNSVVSSAHIEQHCRIVFEKYLLRQQIRICTEGLAAAFTPGADAFESLDTLNGRLTDLSLEKSARDVSTIDSVLVQNIQKIEELRTKKEDITGVPSGFIDLDRITFGWQDTDLIILAARPSVGKTAFALNLARNAALHPFKPTPVAIFSLEMSNSQLVNRILSAESEIWLDKINRGKLDDQDMKRLYANGITKLANAPIFIDDTPALNIFELRAKCRRLKNKNKIGLIVIDYLQLMSGTGERGTTREQVISEISRNLKALAKELRVPVIALSQLSRKVEERADPRPQLSDLRESGAIEQDADMVIFMWREDYGKTDEEKDPMLSGVTTLRIAKHRNGALEEVPMRSDLSIQKFFTVDGFQSYQSGRGNLVSFQQALENGSKLYLAHNSKPTGTNDEDPF